MSLENIIVEEPELVFHTNFDYIIIAIKERQVQKEIKAWLVEGGIQPEAIQCFG